MKAQPLKTRKPDVILPKYFVFISMHGRQGGNLRNQSGHKVIVHNVGCYIFNNTYFVSPITFKKY